MVTNKIKIMGILNVTPDSFSDGGKFIYSDKALFRTEQMIKEGADIIDVGGETTKPGSSRLSAEEELDRVVPIITKIREHFDTIISCDTYKSVVAREAINAGATIINDISGYTMDPKMRDVIVDNRGVVTYVMMHTSGDPKTMQQNVYYNDIVTDIFCFFENKISDLKRSGFDRIIIDPGFGFGKSLDDNYLLLRRLGEFKKLNCPILAGISRKSMIGNVVQSKPEERISGTVALDTIAIMNGAEYIRVHDVKEAYQAVKVVEKYMSVR